MVVLPPAQLMPTLHAPRRCGHGVETHGNTGRPAENAAAAQRLLRLLSSSPRLLLLLSDSYFKLSLKNDINLVSFKTNIHTLSLSVHIGI
jgi:hypothetical protein